MQDFSKDYRLLNSKDFQYLHDKSKCFKTPYLRAFYKVSRLNNSKTRIGFAISKKVGNAVKRNRVKRILKEFFRTSPYKDRNKDLLIVVSPRFLKSFDDVRIAELRLRKDFNFMLSKIFSKDSSII